MYVAPDSRFVAAQVPRAIYWKIPFLPPVPLHPVIEPSPAPMSCDTTAMWTLGSPGGSWSRVMNVGRLRRRLSCASLIEDESSMRNRMSTLRLIDASSTPAHRLGSPAP